MALLTTVVVVSIVLKEIEKKSLQLLDGLLLDIRKNPHVIDVGLEQSILHNYWFIMLMVT
jgi:hypothetical protein